MSRGWIGLVAATWLACIAAPARAQPSSQPVPIPHVGASEGWIDDYLRHLRVEVDLLRYQRSIAIHRDDRARLEEEIRDMDEHWSDEVQRLTRRDSGLIAVGSTLTGAGGALLVSSLFLGFAYALSDFQLCVWSCEDKPKDEGLRTAMVGTLVGGLLGVSAGGPDPRARRPPRAPRRRRGTFVSHPRSGAEPRAHRGLLLLIAASRKTSACHLEHPGSTIVLRLP